MSNLITTSGTNTSKLAILGLLPGYNQEIDDDNKNLERDLLHNINFVDLELATYVLNTPISEFFNKSKDDKENKNVKKIKNDYTDLYKYGPADNKSKILKDFNLLVRKYIEGQKIVTKDIVTKDLNNSAIDNSIRGARIITSSDSLSTETISTSFDESMYSNNLNSLNNSTIGKFTNPIASNLKELDYNSAFDLLVDKSADITTTSIGQMIEGSLLGIKIALPKFFKSSSYSQNLSLFFKLTSPSGNKEIVKKLILDPLKFIMIMSSPISITGLTHSLPFLYRIRGYGNTYISLGYISDITISKGSMETMYSDDQLPLSIDVRLNIKTISENFASILIGDEDQDLKNVGLTSPAHLSGLTINNSKLLSSRFSTPPIDPLVTIKI